MASTSSVFKCTFVVNEDKSECVGKIVQLGFSVSKSDMGFKCELTCPSRGVINAFFNTLHGLKNPVENDDFSEAGSKPGREFGTECNDVIANPKDNDFPVKKVSSCTLIVTQHRSEWLSKLLHLGCLISQSGTGLKCELACPAREAINGFYDIILDEQKYPVESLNFNEEDDDSFTAIYRKEAKAYLGMDGYDDDIYLDIGSINAGRQCSSFTRSEDVDDMHLEIEIIIANLIPDSVGDEIESPQPEDIESVIALLTIREGNLTLDEKKAEYKRITLEQDDTEVSSMLTKADEDLERAIDLFFADNQVKEEKEKKEAGEFVVEPSEDGGSPIFPPIKPAYESDSWNKLSEKEEKEEKEKSGEHDS